MIKVEIPEQLSDALRNVRRVVVLTGAGVSAESNIPTFREAQTGLWEKYDPTELATPQAFNCNPRLVWDWYRWRRELISAAKPNPGHLALVEMEAHIPEFTLVTQNVDGLHRRAGSKNVLELHGNIMLTKCFDCGRGVEIEAGNPGELPRCRDCGGLLRPDVVWFGENLPAAAIEGAMQAARQAEVFFSIGTSALVQPAASLPLYAIQGGATVVEVNPAETPLSAQVQFVLRGPAGEVLPALVKVVWE
ncbi:MAG: NAD-dependent deacylase [Anaerolineales bacterium]|nr:NAD-dependent deacylase [Anaerolineales bacterium]